MKKEWIKEFREKLITSEKKAAPIVARYLREKYKKTAKAYTHEKTAQEIAQEFITADDAANLVKIIYKKVFNALAIWDIKKYREEKTELSDLIELLKERGVNQATLEAIKKGELIAVTQRNFIVRVILELRDNPLFMAMGTKKATRMLLKEFQTISRYHAERIVRTEATNAANKALIQSSKLLFPGRVLFKEWIANIDGKTRPAHREANGKKVPQNGKFFVGGELLENPGGGKKPENNVFCRCAVAITRD